MPYKHLMHDNDKSEKYKMHDNDRFLTDNDKPFRATCP